MIDLERKEYRKNYYINNIDKIKEYNKKWREENKNYNKDYQLKNKEKNKEKRKEYRKNYCLNNKEKIKEYTNNNKDKRKEYFAKWNIDNKEYLKEYRKINKLKKDEYLKNYYEKNKEIIQKKRINNKEYHKKYGKEYHKTYAKNRKKIDPLFKLKLNIRSNIINSIKKKGYEKKSKTFKILGCSYEDFKQHLERQFKTDMNWDNHGQWHLDHIYPVSLAKDEAELIKLNHYTNFQPMWASENISKGNKIIPNTQIKLI